MEVLLRSLTRLANHLKRKKDRANERKEEIKKAKEKHEDDFDDDDKARELNYDLEINRNQLGHREKLFGIWIGLWIGI